MRLQPSPGARQNRTTYVSIDGDLTERSNALYSAIVATVATSRPVALTVREIAIRLGHDVDVTAHCIALHRYLRRPPATLNLAEVEVALFAPLPPGFAIPAADEQVDETSLGL